MEDILIKDGKPYKLVQDSAMEIPNNLNLSIVACRDEHYMINGVLYGPVIVPEDYPHIEKTLEELEKERIANLPKTWEESIKVGSKITMGRKIPNSTKYEYKETIISDSEAWGFKKNTIINDDLAVTNNPKHFSASKALDKLLWLRDIYNGDWKPKLNGAEYYPCITYTINGCKIQQLSCTYRLLIFKTDELAELFLENFKDLLEQAKNLY